jgi:hypothetical protein
MTRSEVYVRLLHDLSAIYPIVDGAPNILGRVYGAAMCDKAIRVGHTLYRLRTGLEDAAKDWDSTRISWDAPSHRTSRTRTSLRARAGEPPITKDDPHYSARRERMPPLSPAEHVQFGADLAAASDALSRAERGIAEAGGSRCTDLLSRVRRVDLFLRRLRSHMGVAVQREHPDGIGGRHAGDVYFTETTTTAAA